MLVLRSWRHQRERAQERVPARAVAQVLEHGAVAVDAELQHDLVKARRQPGEPLVLERPVGGQREDDLLRQPALDQLVAELPDLVDHEGLAAEQVEVDRPGLLLDRFDEGVDVLVPGGLPVGDQAEPAPLGGAFELELLDDERRGRVEDQVQLVDLSRGLDDDLAALAVGRERRVVDDRAVGDDPQAKGGRTLCPKANRAELAA